ncbi:1-aminocyclopropane-1-carboxylate deaminase/D-cysteine desulfhydrase [Halarcobacter anaerophilus]|uniref:1-aminocyclopropane-1-carboxylate deaminase n=1 Tax=Halarcobacter anaerophilus TaxID=877500 RepID=A0A4Q0XXY0_9BACT|nr:1-aminocyclopropane-1-carboxylate deaminase/D-cysteine desulfhydrase [Halarcobacter anaerophilus]QDF28056.1 1-aminocyclopropane-1-carboxylate deaminase [Halarcobacter anaerophilus]RXJ62402.1 1-aminocyclopropane-1-carboxylate deaminase [Halarcobacter anaerophilus]
MNYKNSPIEKINFRKKDIFIKRDDLLDASFSGNKARKFYYFLVNDFNDVEKIVSYGSAQANSLYSLSVLAKLKNLKLDFYVNHISSFLKNNPKGNYKKALENGANIIQKSDCDLQEFIEKNLSKKELFIEEGGRVKEAEFGIKILAEEIKKWAQENKIENLKIVLPSGTGTTALFLQKNLPFEVFTVACVGGSEYLKKQFFHLEKEEKYYPKIIQMPKKYHFGKLYKEFYEIWKELKAETKIEFDLLYDPLGFLALFSSDFFDSKTVLYIHQGGILGNETMSERYKRKYS